MTTNQKIKDYSNCAIGTGAGYLSYKFVPKYLVGKPLSKVFLGVIGHIPQEDHVEIYDKANEALQKSFLKEKGVRFIEVKPENVEEIYNRFAVKNPQLPSFIEKKMNKVFKKLLKDVGKGENAGYQEDLSAVFMNKNRIGFSSFHELGHAINWKKGGFGAFNAGFANIIGLALPLVLITALLKNKKQEGEKPKGFWDKTTTFVRNNCSTIMGLMIVPALIDEAMASINGAKLAKGVLDKRLFNKMNKLNVLAYSSYLISGVMVIGFSKLALIIRDKIVEKKPVK